MEKVLMWGQANRSRNTVLKERVLHLHGLRLTKCLIAKRLGVHLETVKLILEKSKDEE